MVPETLHQEGRWLLRVVLALVVLAVSQAAGADWRVSREPREIRAIWVTRWDYRTPEDVRLIVRNCARHHFNMILFQVRGNGTVFYKSRIEPWAWELSGEGPAATAREPGWNPLKLACYEARKRGVELHAYLNVLPGWRSQDYPPPSAGQLWTAHPEWFMVDRAGNKMIPRTNWYSFLSPGIPEVQDHIEAVFLEVIRKYRIQGVHLDYLRYPSEIDDFSYDPVSLARFEQATGKTPDEATAEWNRWRSDQVTRVEQRICRNGKALRPDLIFSAVFLREPKRGKNRYFQDSERWLQEGTLDVIMPMFYANNLEEFRRVTGTFVRLRRGGWVAPGIGLGRTGKGFLQQVEAAREEKADGAALFAYSGLFRKHEPGARAAELLAGPYREEVRLPWD